MRDCGCELRVHIYIYLYTYSRVSIAAALATVATRSAVVVSVVYVRNAKKHTESNTDVVTSSAYTRVLTLYTHTLDLDASAHECDPVIPIFQPSNASDMV